MASTKAKRRRGLFINQPHMLDYSTCRALKDAGFPQEVEGSDQPIYYYNNQVTIYKKASFTSSSALTNDHYKIPTLSELIEAIGDKFEYLWRDPMGTWKAESTELIPEVFGSTPEESVARLYLAINSN